MQSIFCAQVFSFFISSTAAGCSTVRRWRVQGQANPPYVLLCRSKKNKNKCPFTHLNTRPRCDRSRTAAVATHIWAMDFCEISRTNNSVFNAKLELHFHVLICICSLVFRLLCQRKEILLKFVFKISSKMLTF